MTDDHADTDLTDHHGEAEALRKENVRLRAALHELTLPTAMRVLPTFASANATDKAPAQEWTGMGGAVAQKADPNCQCVCHLQPGVLHTLACCQQPTSPAPAQDAEPVAGGTPITMTYRNYRGQVDQRTVVPTRIWFGSTDWHPEPGWLMSAYDLAKAAHRDFALADCQFADLAHPADAESLRGEVDVLRTAGISEIAARNPNVMDYMKHWESRAEKAEAERDAALARVAALEAQLAALTPPPDAELDALVEQLSSFNGDGYTRFAGKTMCERAAAAITALRAKAEVKGLDPAEVLTWLDGIANPTPAQSPIHMARNYEARIRAALGGG